MLLKFKRIGSLHLSEPYSNSAQSCLRKYGSEHYARNNFAEVNVVGKKIKWVHFVDSHDLKVDFYTLEINANVVCHSRQWKMEHFDIKSSKLLDLWLACSIYILLELRNRLIAVTLTFTRCWTALYKQGDRNILKFIWN